MTADLQELFDRTGRNAPAPVLDPDAVLDRARRSRHRRVWLSSVAVGVAAGVAAVVVFAAGGSHQAGPLPPAHPPPTPSPTRSLFTLATDPFLTPDDITYYRVTRQDPVQPRPSRCLSDPRTWGATGGGAQTYIDPHHADMVINEFVLRYDDTASAHRAVLDARDQLNTCTSPREVAVDPAEIQTPDDSVGMDPPIADYLAGERNLFPTAARTDGTDTVYTVRAARAGNLLVVIEDTRRTSPRPNLLLTVALRRAVLGPLYDAPPWCAELLC